MANTATTSGGKLPLATLIWVASAGALLLGTVTLSGKMLLSREHYREEALASARRVEFSPDKGEILGKLLTLEELSLAKLTGGKPEAAPASQPKAAEPHPASEPAHEAAPSPTNAPAPAHHSPETPPPSETTPATGHNPAETVEPHAAAQETKPETSTPLSAEPSAASPPPSLAEPAPEVPPTPQEPQLAPVEHHTEQGIVPAIAADGTQPWQYFAKTGYEKVRGPRIAIAITGLGQAKLPTEAAISLPAEVTLAFSPYGREATAAWAETAKQKGHEVLLDLPMQTDRFPAVDPGPYGLLATLTPAQNDERLTAMLAKARGYVGMLSPAHEILSEDTAAIGGVMETLAKHGLLLLNSRSVPPAGMFKLARKSPVPLLYTDIILDERVVETYIKNQLARAEDLARRQGYAIVLGHSYPVTLELVDAWARGLKAKGFSLVPLTTLAKEAKVKK